MTSGLSEHFHSCPLSGEEMEAYADADAVEVYNNRRPRLGPLLRGATRFPEVASYESNFLRDESLPR